MTYTVCWRRSDGSLFERTLPLDPLTQFLAGLEEPATVTDEKGAIVGEVYVPREALGSHGYPWRWYVELSPRSVE